MAKLKTAHLSAETIEAITAALFSRVANANTALREAVCTEGLHVAGMWVAQRTQGLSALRDVLTYAESLSLKSPGSGASMCTLAASYTHDGD